ncbi:MAG: hypothetical protein ACYCW6_21710 [Candidatus Xenobia bacterium]
MLKQTWLAALILTALVVPGCVNAPNSVGGLPPVGLPAPGTWCVFQFKREALGYHGTTPVGPQVMTVDNYPVCCKGKFVGADDRYVVLEGGTGAEHTKMWIPTSNVLDFYLAPPDETPSPAPSASSSSNSKLH